MSAIEILSISAPIVASLVGGIYVAVRLAIRAEVQALEIRVGEKYVTATTCRSIRADCDRYHAATAAKVVE